HEDDPERAVRSALEMLHAVKELNDTDPGLDLRIRAGAWTAGGGAGAAAGRPRPWSPTWSTPPPGWRGWPRPAACWSARRPGGPPGGPSPTARLGRWWPRARPTPPRSGSPWSRSPASGSTWDRATAPR